MRPEFSAFSQLQFEMSPRTGGEVSAGDSDVSRGREYGDFQTPPDLVRQVLEVLRSARAPFARMLEPTCGIGNFIAGALELEMAPEEIWGLEVQPQHVEHTRARIDTTLRNAVHVELANLFDLDLRQAIRWSTSGPLLVVGNPPWVTNAELGSLRSANVPAKSNFKRLPGILAMTGGANFDIAEYMILKLIGELSSERPTIAMLCKTAVARNVLEYAQRAKLPIARAEIRKIDASRYFGAAVDACLFCFDVEPGSQDYDTRVYAELGAASPVETWGVVDGVVVSDMSAYAQASYAHGRFSLEWRQGVKHDAASVMELVRRDNALWNGLGETLDIEADFIYPLAKGSDLFHGRFHNDTQRFAIITQRDLREDPERLQVAAPKLWKYLLQHETAFARRKSSIYRGKSRFSIFGVGAYTFAPFKVAVSSLHREPRFRIVGDSDGQPIVLDDTCYFVGCASAQQAAVIAALLAHPDAAVLLRSLSPTNAKRVVTKRTLRAIDLGAVLHRCDRAELAARAEALLSAMAVSSHPLNADTFERFLVAEDVGSAARKGAIPQPAFL